MVSETVHIEGHIVDSLTLSKVLDIILQQGGVYRIRDFHIGRTKSESSRAAIEVDAESQSTLDSILHEIGKHGAARAGGEATLSEVIQDGVFPEDFYSTTNLETHVRCGHNWICVEPIEMDCAIRISESNGVLSAASVPLHRIRKGDRIVTGDVGVRVSPIARLEPGSAFSFMGSTVSTERSKELVVNAVALGMQEARRHGQKILLVGGPAIIHTGAGKYLEELIASGWIDLIFAGNALATHDIEQALYGTSLGVDAATGMGVAHGHEHHLRAINRIRSAGSIRAAVEQGVLNSGIMYACVKHGVDFILAGSIRDDGPLPDVITDSVVAQDAMRDRIGNVGIAIMVATTLHSVATGNLLPASVQTVCVDSDADTVIKLMDRGTHQAAGLVTDCEFFMKELNSRLR